MYMYTLWKTARRPFCLLALGLILFASAFTARGDEPTPDPESSGLVKVAVYDPDPSHLLNRLYAAFYVRVTTDGQSTGHDELDAPLWRQGSHLMREPSYSRAIEVLDEFLERGGEQQVGDRVKRAMLQRDLWAIFDYLASPQPWIEEWRKKQGLSHEQGQLLERLARAIKRLALSREEIERLPDNYALAVSAKAFPAEHDPANGGRAFLPPDLLEADGSWVPYGDPNEVTALEHNRAYSGRAIFLVLLKLPEGRVATRAYLRRFPNRLVNTIGVQIEEGTQVALVKQALLIDDQGQIRPTPITEQLQLRVYHKLDNPDAYEFHLTRKKLFAGIAGGLHPISEGELHFSAFRETRTQSPLDPFEHALRASMPIPLPREPSDNQNLMKSCLGCHQANRRPGIGSFLTHGPLNDRESLIRATIRWKQEHSTWGLWRGLSLRDE